MEVGYSISRGFFYFTIFLISRPLCNGIPDEGADDYQQVCPMCEARFSSIEVTREDFVTHVNSHFSFEDDLETLQNYEIIQH